MAKFLFVCRSASGTGTPMTPDEIQQHMERWKDRKSRKFRRRAPRRATTYRPQVEALEDRRLLSVAVLDSSFGQFGRVTGVPVNAFVQLANGNLLAVGAVASNGSQNQSIQLEQFNSDGTLDTSFGNNGIVTTPLNVGQATSADPVAIALAPDNSIVVAVNGSNPQLPAVGLFLAAKYDASGDLDTAFGTIGFAQATFSSSVNGVATALVVQSDGKIVEAGQLSSGAVFALARFNADGSLDGSFGTGGLVTTDFNSEATASLGGIALQADNKIVATGSVGNGMTGVGQAINYVVARYNMDGSLDTSFGDVGTVTDTFTSQTSNVAKAVGIQPDGKIIIAGQAYSITGNPPTQSVSQSALVRYNTDGTLDPSFGPGGKVVTGDNGGSGFVVLAVLSDTSLIAAGDSRMVEYAPTGPGGALERQFVSPPLLAGHVNGIAITADGKIVLSATTLLGRYRVVSGTVDNAYAVAADAGGGPQVQVYNALTNTLLYSFFAYDPSFTGGVRVALADVNNDGVPDIVTAPGPGGGPEINVYDGQTGQLMKQFFAFSPSFAGGCYVAAGDTNGDNFADIIVGADAGGGPNVTVFSGQDYSVIRSFFAFAPTFTGGVRVAAVHTTPDALSDIVCGAGPGGGPNVMIFRGADNTLLASFFAFDPSFTGGVYLAMVDRNAAGTADILAGAGAGGGPEVALFRFNFQLGTVSLDTSFFAYAPGFTGGVRVGSFLDVNSSHSDILTTPGPGGGPQVQIFDGATLQTLDSFFALNPSFSGGLFAGGQVH